jgi:hypothetical protein
MAILSISRTPFHIKGDQQENKSRVLPHLSFYPNVFLSLIVHICILAVQGVIESCTDILTTSYWLHVELGKNIKKILCQKIK